MSLKDANKLAVVTPKYLEFTKLGEAHRLYFLGFCPPMRKVTSQGEVLYTDIAAFFNPDERTVYQNAGAQLTRQLRNLKPGTAVEITLADQKQNARGGKTKIYTIAVLDAPAMEIPEYVAVLAPAAELTTPQLPAPEEATQRAAPAAPSMSADEAVKVLYQ